MRPNKLPDRSIAIDRPKVKDRVDGYRDSIDDKLLDLLEERPTTTAYAAERIEEQPSYVTKRLRHLQEYGVLYRVRRGFYEVNPRVIVDEK